MCDAFFVLRVHKSEKLYYTRYTWMRDVQSGEKTRPTFLLLVRANVYIYYFHDGFLRESRNYVSVFGAKKML